MAERNTKSPKLQGSKAEPKGIKPSRVKLPDASKGTSTKTKTAQPNPQEEGRP